MHIDDIRMAEFSGLAHLLAQQLERLGVNGFLQDLDRKGLADHLFIGREVHHPHPTLTELALDAVAAGEPLTDRQPFIEAGSFRVVRGPRHTFRSEEHTSELQSPMYLVCRLLLEKKNKPQTTASIITARHYTNTPSSEQLITL